VTDHPDATVPLPTARHPGLSRRGAIAGLCGACVAATLTGCDVLNGAEPEESPPAPQAPPTPEQTPTPDETATPDAETPTEEPGNSRLLGKPSDIPVGGGVVYTAQKVVVTQPEEGTFKGFSAVCTHQGTIVNKVSDGAIHCPRHFSEFSIKDGSVLVGPAELPLPPVELDVARNTISLV
jgi:Rieske Fe-S protein